MSRTQAIDESEAQEKTPDAAEPIAAYLARMRYDDLPAAVVYAVKISILDTLGCIIAGTSTADVATISSMVRAWGGAPTCTVIGSGGLKLPPISAAKNSRNPGKTSGSRTSGICQAADFHLQVSRRVGKPNTVIK